MEGLTRDSFVQWANDPMTVKVRDYMLSEREKMNNLDNSGLLEKCTYSTEGLTSLEVLGLETAMRTSVIRGIDAFVEFDNLIDELFEEVTDAED